MKRLIFSFKWAISGIWQNLQGGRNFRLMWIFGCLVCFLNGYFSFSIDEQFILLIAIILVLTLELLNSAIENLCNLYDKNPHKLIKNIKDISAGSVLLASIGSLIVFIFIIYKNMHIISPFILSFKSLDFILFFVFTFHQSIKGKSSKIDAISSIVTLFFILAGIKNYLWSILGVLAFLLWQTALIFNTLDIHAYKSRFGKNRTFL